ncbi:MAG: hypothetical protein HQL90_08550 [Magnetococcales bacterium]|nr:hypothetical protein [Magnetococcales bacterium]
MLTSSTQRRQAGMGLVELLMGILVGSLLLGGLVTLYVSTSKANADNIKLARLNQEVRAMMGIMTREIRRAGYWGVVPGTAGVVGNPAWITAIYGAGIGAGTVKLSSNPFWQATDDLTIGQLTGAAANSCITFSYDLDEDNSVDDEERLGFRLNNGVVEMRLGGTPASCNSGSYTPMNDGNLTTVTALSFALASTPLNINNPGSGCVAGQGCQTIRQVTIGLTVQLLGNAAVSQSITEQVRIRNDLYVP